jgi:hypothetical protein
MLGYIKVKLIILVYQVYPFYQLNFNLLKTKL